MWWRPCSMKWNVDQLGCFSTFMWNRNLCSVYSSNVHRKTPLVKCQKVVEMFWIQSLKFKRKKKNCSQVLHSWSLRVISERRLWESKIAAEGTTASVDWKNLENFEYLKYFSILLIDSQAMDSGTIACADQRVCWPSRNIYRRVLQFVESTPSSTQLSAAIKKCYQILSQDFSMTSAN